MNLQKIFLYFFISINLVSCGSSDVPQEAVRQTAQPQAPDGQSAEVTTIDGPVSPANIPSGTYAVDKMHTYLTFSYLHLGYSYPRLRVTGIDGELKLDGENMANSSVAIAIDADTIDTKMSRFDKELKSLQYFNVANYPYITYSSHSYEALSETTGKLNGFLTIKGITRPVALDVTINNATINPFYEKPVIGFNATGSLNRSDFKLGRNVPFVGDKVYIDISMEFVQGNTDTSTAAAKIATDTTASAPPESLVIPTHEKAIAGVGSNIPGKYDIAFRLPTGDTTSVLTLNADGTGTMTIPDGVSELNSIKYDGNDFSYILALQTPMGEMELQYEGTVDGDEITDGRLKTPMGTQLFQGTRIK